MAIPGKGNETFSITSARDIAAVVSQMLQSRNKWRQFTYVQAEETTWLKIAEIIRTSGNMPDLKAEFVSVDELKAAFERNESMEAMAVTEFKLYVPSGKLQFVQEKLKRDKAEFFLSVHAGYCT